MSLVVDGAVVRRGAFTLDAEFEAPASGITVSEPGARSAKRTA